MSTAVLNVWISNLGDACTVANDIGSGIPYHWSVAVLHCDGRVLNWSEGRYRLHHEEPWTHIAQHTPSGGTLGWWYEMIPTRDGHVEIEVPPGCYIVVGSMHTWFTNGLLYGNWATDRAIVGATCGADVCVKLYASTLQSCWNLLGHALRAAVEAKVVAQADADTTLKALQKIHKPADLTPFERGFQDLMTRTAGHFGKASPHEPKKK